MKVYFTAVSKSWDEDDLDDSEQIVNISDTMTLKEFFKKLKKYQKILNPKKPNVDRWILDFDSFNEKANVEFIYYDDYAE